MCVGFLNGGRGFGRGSTSRRVTNPNCSRTHAGCALHESAEYNESWLRFACISQTAGAKENDIRVQQRVNGWSVNDVDAVPNIDAVQRRAPGTEALPQDFGTKVPAEAFVGHQHTFT